MRRACQNACRFRLIGMVTEEWENLNRFIWDVSDNDYYYIISNDDSWLFIILFVCFVTNVSTFERNGCTICIANRSIYWAFFSSYTSSKIIFINYIVLKTNEKISNKMLPIELESNICLISRLLSLSLSFTSLSLIFLLLNFFLFLQKYACLFLFIWKLQRQFFIVFRTKCCHSQCGGWFM